jgi:hypothetical protein
MATQLERIMAEAVDQAETAIEANPAARADLKRLLLAGRQPHVVKPCYVADDDDDADDLPRAELFLQIRLPDE